MAEHFVTTMAKVEEGGVSAATVAYARLDSWAAAATTHVRDTLHATNRSISQSVARSVDQLQELWNVSIDYLWEERQGLQGVQVVQGVQGVQGE